MRLRNITLLMASFALASCCFAQKNPYPSSVPVRDPAVFFADMYGKRLAATRGEFETRAEYEARVPPWPKDKIIYFSVPYMGGKKSYSYNPDTLTATVYGGVPRLLNNARVKEIIGGYGILLDYKEGKSVRYTAQNAFGVKVRVTATAWSNLILVPYNPYRLIELNLMNDPRSEEATEQLFKVPIKLDINTAKSVLPDLEIVLGVTFEDYRSALEGQTVEEKPTIDDPAHNVIGSVGFVGHLERVLIRNRKDNKVWKTYLVAPGAQP